MRLDRIHKLLLTPLAIAAAVTLSSCASDSATTGSSASSPAAAASSSAASSPDTAGTSSVGSSTSANSAGSSTSAASGSVDLHSALPQAIQDAGVIRFAGDSHPPYRTVGADGAITGIDKDFQDALGAVLGVSTEIEIVNSLPTALQGMQSGRYDAFNGPVKATAEREADFDSITWMTTQTSYVVPTANETGIASADDLCGKKVAVVTASVVEEQLKKLSAYCEGKGASAVEIVGLADTNATLLAATSGRADAAGMTETAAIDVITQQEGQYTYVTQTEAQGATTDPLALLTPKSSGLGPVMLQAYQELFKNGEYQRIMEKWKLQEVMVDEPVLNIATS